MKYWDKALSLISGCTPISPACDNCWLAGMEYRFDKCPGLLQIKDEKRIPKFNGNIILHKDRLNIPMRIKKPTVFAIWSDLFHEKVPASFITEAFEIMEYCKQHTFLICTKRPKRIFSVLYGQEGNWYLGGGDYMPNIYLGTTVENQEMVDKRIPELLKCKPFKLFLSIEPMLERIDISNICIDASTENNPGDIRPISDFNYIIAGCESGPRARETKEEWVRDLRDQCLNIGVPLWVKQLKINGKMVYNHSLSTINIKDLWK